MAIDPSDPYFQQHAGLSRSLINAVLGYGDASALTPQYAQEFGIDPNSVQAAGSNPYSTLHQLANQLSGDNTGIQRSANAHGALFSGANAAATAHETQAAGLRNYNAQQGLQNTLAGIQTTDLTNLTGATDRAAQAALNDPTIPAAPATDSAAPAPISQTPTAPTTLNPAAQNGLGSPFVNPSLNQPKAQPVPKVKAATTLASQAARGLIGHA